MGEVVLCTCLSCEVPCGAGQDPPAAGGQRVSSPPHQLLMSPPASHSSSAPSAQLWLSLEGLQVPGCLCCLQDSNPIDAGPAGALVTSPPLHRTGLLLPQPPCQGETQRAPSPAPQNRRGKAQGGAGTGFVLRFVALGTEPGTFALSSVPNPLSEI